MISNTPPRRPIQARHTQWAMAITRLLIKNNIRPNNISVASMVFALAASLCLFLSKDKSFGYSTAMYVLCALSIQMRLLCNMFDGMVAIEGGFKSSMGGIFNELPDRIADTLIIVPLGYLCGRLPFAPELGWLAALLAMLTAYIRLLGDTTGARQYFLGPMAKPHRMALITCALLVAGGAYYFYEHVDLVFYSLLWILIAGCIITCIRRLGHIAKDLNSQ